MSRGKRGSAEDGTERRQQMFKLRCAGASYEQIGKQFGISAPAAFKHVKIVLSRINEATQNEALEWRALELERIDIATRAIAKQVQGGDYQAIDRWVKLMERRAKLLGLDAPQKIAPTDPTGTEEYAGLTDEERAARTAAIYERARQKRTRQSDTDSTEAIPPS